MKIITRILSVLLCFVLFISTNIVNVEAASITVARTEKLVADKETASTVELRWRKVSKATGYKVYRVVDGKLKALKTVKTNKYVVEDLTASETYKFAVKTYRKYNGKTYWSSKYRSVTVTTKNMGKAPTPTATATKNSVTLKWAEVEGATGYRVYQYSPSKDEYVVKASIKGAETYTVKNLKENNTYKFKIKPYAKTSDGVKWVKASSAVSIKTVDKTKAKFGEAVIGSKGVTLSWEKVPGATHYMIFTLENGEYTKIATAIKSTSYKVERLKSGEEYTFVVRGYKKVDGKVTKYPLSDPLTIKTKGTAAEEPTNPEEPTTTPSTNPSVSESTTKPTTTEPTTTKPTTTKPTTTKPTTTKPTTTKPTTTKPTTTKPTTTKPTTTKPTTTEPTTTKPTTTKPTTTKPTEHKHTVVVDRAVEATCTRTGLTEGKHCSACGEVIVAQQVVSKKAHTIVTISAVEATCTKTGLTAGKKCSVCGEITVAQKTVDKKDHTIVTEEGFDATCITQGATDGKKCSVCGKVTVAQNTIPLKDHNDTDNDGKCDYCGEVLKEPEQELTAYRVDKSKKILEKDTVYFKISSEYSDGTMVPIEFAMKKGNMFMETTAEGMTMRIYYDKSTNKMFAYAYLLVGWMYYEVPENEMEDMDMTEMLEVMQIGDHGYVTVSRETFDGKSVICESFLDNSTGYTVKYYFDGETLIGIKRTHPKKDAETIYVDKVNNSVKDSIFNKPLVAVPVPM
jgi:hypothetical protein